MMFKAIRLCKFHFSIAKAIIEAHGGVIKVESEEDKGSTFTLSFPEAIFDTRGEEASPLSGKRIFVLQRFPEFRAALTDLFEAAGADADRQALHAYTQHSLATLEFTKRELAGVQPSQQPVESLLAEWR